MGTLFQWLMGAVHMPALWKNTGKGRGSGGNDRKGLSAGEPGSDIFDEEPLDGPLPGG
jgi:hypothetical protein